MRKSEYFRRALDGRFQEAENQAIDLPEEDPSIFSFVVAYLYEEKFVPIKPIASVLIVEPEKGKGRKDEEEANSDSGDGSDTAGSASDERYGIPIDLNNPYRKSRRTLSYSEDPPSTILDSGTGIGLEMEHS